MCHCSCNISIGLAISFKQLAHRMVENQVLALLFSRGTYDICVYVLMETSVTIVLSSFRTWEF